MDWLTVGMLTAIISGLTVALVRTVRRGRRRRWIYLIPIVTALLALRWAAYRQTWVELGLAALISAVVCATWWFTYGRHLPPPTDDNIRVWTKDDPF
jgi:hypothetical protein